MLNIITLENKKNSNAYELYWALYPIWGSLNFIIIVVAAAERWLCLYRTIIATSPVVHPSYDNAHGGADRENWTTLTKTCPSATETTTDSTWTTLKANPFFSSEKVATNHLSYGLDFCRLLSSTVVNSSNLFLSYHVRTAA
jgi:hypothetical protein